LLKVIFAEQHNLDRPDPLGSHHYIRHFKKAGWDCLWLGPAISPVHIFKPDALNRHRFRVCCQGIRKSAEQNGIAWMVPFSMLFYYNLPLLNSLYAGRNQYRFCLPPLAGRLKNIGFSPVDLLWLAGPSALSLLDLVPHHLSCYRLADRLDQFSRIPRNVAALQEEVIKRVDFVLATSLALADWAESIKGEEVYYLPNGVSEIFFDTFSAPPEDFPKDGRPVAVYVGTLDTRFDLDLLAQAALVMKDFHFLIIGPLTDHSLKAGLKVLQDEENFTWLGPKEQAAVPAYLRHSTVGMIPFKLNELTEAVNPIKYFEYLACGLPVVAPPMRELTSMQGPLYPYQERDGFSKALREALKAGQREGAANVEYASRQTWAGRFEQVMKIVDQKMPVPS